MTIFAFFPGVFFIVCSWDVVDAEIAITRADGDASESLKIDV